MASDGSTNRYVRPGWFTKHVFNRLVQVLTSMGISVWGSRTLWIRGRSSGEWRSNPVNLLLSMAIITLWHRAARLNGCVICVLQRMGNYELDAKSKPSPRQS
jgi:hypothetical protein